MPPGTSVPKQVLQDQMKLKPQIRFHEIQNQSYLYGIRFCLTASKDPKFIYCTFEYVVCASAVLFLVFGLFLFDAGVCLVLLQVYFGIIA